MLIKKINNWTKFINLLKIRCVIIVFLLGIVPASAVDIDFDIKYGVGGNIAANITKAINEANVNDVILFNSPTYNLNGGNVTISKGVTLKGATPVNFDPNAKGATGIVTTFINCGKINVKANNVTIQDLAMQEKQSTGNTVLIDLRHPTYSNRNVDQNKWYTGIVFNNVALSDSSYIVHAGNGVGGTFTNVSFSNFNLQGFWLNRQGRVDSHPKITWNKCLFDAPGLRFSNRGISLDAGNEEYPVLWDHNETTIENCLFINTGIGASSRGKSVIIKNNIFNDFKGNVDMVHIEEFSSNFTIDGNTFNSRVASGSKIIVIDRNLQISSDIDITNNIITGKYRFFISAYAPNNITITGNDFNAANTTGVSMNFTFYEDAIDEPIIYPFVSDGIVIKNNPGLNLSKNGTLILNIKKNGAQNTLQDYPLNRQKIKKFDPPKSIIENGIYEIENKATGKKLCPDFSGNNRLTTKQGTGDNFKWKITFNPPFTYTVQNMASSKYLETNVGYTENDIFRNKPQNKFPFVKNTYAGSNVRPFWVFVKKGTVFEMHPGGNEKQSAIATNNTEVKLIHSKQPVGTKLDVKPLSINAMWKFIKIPEITLGNNEILNKTALTPFAIYPNPTSGILNIQYSNSNKKQSFVKMYTIYGELVFSRKLQKNKTSYQFDISNLSKGVYFMKMNTNNTRKIIVK